MYVDGNFVFKKPASGSTEEKVGENVQIELEVLNRAGAIVRTLNGDQIKALVQATGEAQITNPTLVFSQGQGFFPIYSTKAETVTISIKDGFDTGFSTADTISVTYNPGGLLDKYCSSIAAGVCL